MTTCEAMEKYGGSFVRALGAAMYCADRENGARLQAAFPEYFEQYGKIARQRTESAMHAAAVAPPPYPVHCMQPEKCAGKGYCPRDPTCVD